MLAPPPLPSTKPKAGEPLEGSVEAEIARIRAECVGRVTRSVAPPIELDDDE